MHLVLSQILDFSVCLLLPLQLLCIHLFSSLVLREHLILLKQPFANAPGVFFFLLFFFYIFLFASSASWYIFSVLMLQLRLLLMLTQYFFSVLVLQFRLFSFFQRSILLNFIDTSAGFLCFFRILTLFRLLGTSEAFGTSSGGFLGFFFFWYAFNSWVLIF